MFYNPVRIEFGSAGFAELPELLGGRKATVVTTPGMERRGVVRKLRGACPGADLRVFTGVRPNPTIHSISSGARDVLSHGQDVLIALGGGSAIDTAKGIASLASPGCSDSSWLSNHLREAAPFPPEFSPLPIIGIPTTAGTGSEVTKWGTVWDEQNGAKFSISHPRLFPEAALLVPELTLTLPNDLTLFAGLDAISHCMESIWNRHATAVSDAFAVAGLKKLLPSLGDALEHPQDLPARRRMQEGALLGGLAISSTATALAHSMSYPLTSRFGMPHGLACSFTLPELIRFNGETAPPRLHLITEAMGTADIAGAAVLLEDMFERWRVSDHVRRYVDNKKVAELEQTLITPARAGNNLRTATPKDALGIIHRSLR